MNFHFSCLEKWKKTAPRPVKCPLCRYKWKESSPNTQTLNYVDEETFDIYIEWLYRKKILATSDDVDDRCEHLVDAYIAGTYFKDEEFCTALLHSIIEACVDGASYPTQRIVEIAYEHIDEPCSLRELFVDIYTRLGNGAWDIKSALNNAPKEFLYDLSMSLLRTSSADEGEEWTAKVRKSAQLLQPINDTDDEDDEENEEDNEDKSSSDQDG